MHQPPEKYLSVAIFVIFVAFGAACFSAKPQRYVISESRSYEASLYRQNCAICHGPEAEGKTLDDGRVVPSLRAGEFKTHTEAEIFNQIANGGNGMAPFRGQLTDREIQLMTEFVARDLRTRR